ncbi:hypothetical protein M993_03681 [Obesumbacterium proteus ATCC 12841]|uniref:Uncharacterized protein n=1 Tax=Obesumbacterium proteus ATCC 12841 TaxID=1354268 RepID=A0AA91INN5_9GAMM|nr:hypothetical protein DSM2777_15645 [Obesumbacterium proteus]OAT57937.1 hypothetical protein M993_03681 [Obesumbacterium proteus ATCC 12841]
MTTNNTLQVYTSEFTAEILLSLDISPFSAETLSTLSIESLAMIREQEAYIHAHPPVEFLVECR